MDRFLILGVVLMVFCSQLQAESITFSYDSEEGDHIGQGGSATWTEADGSWQLRRNSDNGVSFDFFEPVGSFFWFIDFASQFDFVLDTQTYPDAERYPNQSFGRPGLRVFGENRSCSTITGQFSIDSILYDWYGTPVRFSAEFEQHCEDAEPALLGTMEYDLEFGGTDLTDGNILVSHDNRIYEYNLKGERKQVFPILGVLDELPEGTEYVRDIAVSPEGLVHVFNGTFDPVMSTGDPVSETWRHDNHPFWNTVNSTTYGGIGIIGRYVFVTDMIGVGFSGIVRFDKISGFSSQRFRDEIQYIDLNIGLDGLLYALRSGGSEGGTRIDVFSPSDMSLLRTIELPEYVRSVAASSDGNIFGAHLFGQLYSFDAEGQILNSVETNYRFADIDISHDGTIVLGADRARVVVTSRSLGSFTDFQVGSGFDGVFVTFVGLDQILLKDDFESE